MTVHEDIRIPFEIEGRRFEAVGFLREKEGAVSGNEMLRRTAGENGGAIGEKDAVFFLERPIWLPVELQPYYLVTNRRCPGRSQEVLCFYFNGYAWNRYQLWRRLVNDWENHYLVLRRCS